MLDDPAQRSGTFLQIDHSVVHSKAKQEGLELMSTTAALEKYPWLPDYWWQAVSPGADKFTAEAERNQHHGYFIRALPGVKAIQPVQTCLYIISAWSGPERAQCHYRRGGLGASYNYRLCHGEDRERRPPHRDFRVLCEEGCQDYLHHDPQLGAQDGSAPPQRG